MDTTPDPLIERAKGGDREALEALIRSIQDQVYRLALRMLYYPADAEDAAQEILIKVITHLDSFRRECAFTTWVYRIAANHLTTIRKHAAEHMNMTFENVEAGIERQRAAASPAPVLEAEQALVVQEIMISCMQAMLQCLDRNHRLAYILGQIAEIQSHEAACILEITPAAFRKRVSRARKLLHGFMKKNCGLVNPGNPCHCTHYIHQFINTYGNDPEKLVFARHPCRTENNKIPPAQLQEMTELQRAVALFRSHPEYAAPERFVQNIKDLVDSGRFSLFA